MIKRLPHGFASPLILVAVGLIVGVGITFAYFQLKSKSAPQPVPTTTPQTTNQSSPVSKVSPTPSVDKTAGLKTYTNSKAKISFNYPNTWEVIGENYYSSTYLSLSLAPQGWKDQHPDTAGGTIIIGVSPNPKNLPIEDIVQKPFSETGACCLFEQFGAKYAVWSDIKIDDVVGRKAEKNATLGEGTIVYLPKGNLIYWIDADGQNTEILNTFNQILSTFKFQ